MLDGHLVKYVKREKYETKFRCVLGSLYILRNGCVPDSCEDKPR